MRRADPRGPARWFTCILLLAALLGGCSSGAPPPDLDVAAPGESGSDEGADAPVGPDPEVVAPEPLPPPPPPVPAGRDQLVARAGALLAAARAESATGDLSVLVVDEHGREILDHRAAEAFLPASTLKLVTAAAALSTFGPDARFRTRVEVTAPIDGEGVLTGDVVLVGSGDPVLATPEYERWVYPARPRTPLEELADALVEAGLRELRGDLVGVADRFDGPNVAEGWPDRYFSSLDARYADGLSVDGGLRTLVTYPETVAGSLPTGAMATPPTGDEGVEPTVRVDHAPDPAAHAAAELGRLLAERGVELRGGARSGLPGGEVVGRIAVVESPPLSDLLRFAVQRSDNQMSDALFRAVGRARTGTGSFASGDRAVRQVLDRYGIEHTDARFADGSGLSRDDRASSRLLVELDRAMLNSRHATTWTSLMAVMGQSGTLETRLRGSPAAGRFAGKTGTLNDVHALVGTVHGEGSRRYHLAVIANDAGATRWAARTLADELILLLVADLDA